MRDRKDGIYLVLAWLAERLPDGSQVRREIAERSPLTQIRQASAGERLNTDNLTGEAARTYRDIIGVVGYAEPFLAGDERVVIANYVSDFAIDDGFGLHTAEQHPSFVERLGRPSSGSRERRSIARPSSSRTASSYGLRSGGLMDP